MAFALLNTVSQSEFTDLTERIWGMGPEMLGGMPARSLFIEQNMAAHTGDTRRFQEIDVETYANMKREGEDATVSTVSHGYSLDMTVRRFAKEVNITWEMRRFNKEPEVVAQLTNLAHFCPQRMELDLTHRLSFATATSYTDLDGETVSTVVGDTLALVSASHTLTDSASTYSNLITGNPVFSPSALQVAEERANTQMLSNLGERRVMNFNTIITSDDPATVHAVKQLLASEADVDQSNSGVMNTFRGRYRHVVLPQLASTAVGAYDSTKANYWGLASIGNGAANSWQAYLGIWEAANLKTPGSGNNGEDVHNDNWTYGTRCAYGIATVSGRGLLWSTGAGS